MTTITLPGRAGGAEIAVNLGDFPESIREALALHGLQQKVADAAANAQKLGWTEDQARAACMSVFDAIKAGQWTRRASGPRMGNEEAFVITRLIAQMKAKAKAKNLTVTDDALRAKAEAAMTDERHAELIAAIRAEWAAKQAAKSIDMDDLL